MKQQVYITNIQKFSTHDGPGIRTNIFFKGCSLRCKWCSNPENITFSPQLKYYATKCIVCGKCTEVCPNKALRLEKESLKISETDCTGCGLCVKFCPSNALVISGEKFTSDEVFSMVNQDKPFYKNSGGGITFSGGEPLLFPEFIKPIASKCRQEGYSTAVETCGYFNLSDAKELLPLIDCFLFDLKLIDDTKHIHSCGKSNKVIHDNFDYLIKHSAEIIPRIPIIPTINDTSEDISLLSSFLKKYKDSLEEVHILPYHNMGACKYEQLQIPYTLSHLKPPEKNHMEHIKRKLEETGLKIAIGG